MMHSCGAVVIVAIAIANGMFLPIETTGEIALGAGFGFAALIYLFKGCRHVVVSSRKVAR